MSSISEVDKVRRCGQTTDSPPESSGICDPSRVGGKPEMAGHPMTGNALVPDHVAVI
jgi:hypothetical protein